MLSRADWITYYAGVAQIHAANVQAAASSPSFFASVSLGDVVSILGLFV